MMHSVRQCCVPKFRSRKMLERKLRSHSLVVLAALFLSLRRSHALIHTVSPSSDLGLVATLAAVGSGDIIQLEPGHYTGEPHCGGKILTKRSVQIFGDNSVLNCSDRAAPMEIFGVPQP
eukprot:3450500-Rhodomonas_salina.1